jgi:hypothetical protein
MKKLLLAACAALALVGCSDGANLPRGTAKDQAAKNGAAVANEIMSGSQDNAEQDNIARRLRLTRNPGQIGFILLMNQAGQPIMYTGVRGKVTSGGKRLTNPQQLVNLNCGQYCGEAIGEGPSDEGTYGHSGEYIFFWTLDGQYVQWNGSYLYSDKPFRTNVAPLVVKIEGDSSTAKSVK